METDIKDQWTLNRLNFQGCWQGRGAWFGRDADDRLDLASPIRVMDPTTYDISFSDPDTGVWDGSGLFFAPGGQARYDISRSSYNTGGGCWQFQGAGGQSSLTPDPDRRRFGHEINLFHGRSRSMLVLIWEPVGTRWRLQLVGTVGFRCRMAPAPEPERPAFRTAEAMLAPLQGCSGVAETFRPQPGCIGQVSTPQPTVFIPDQFMRYERTAVTQAGLIFSVPEYLPEGSFQLEIGGLLGVGLFQQLSILFDANSRLSAWERRRFLTGTHQESLLV